MAGGACATIALRSHPERAAPAAPRCQAHTEQKATTVESREQPPAYGAAFSFFFRPGFFGASLAAPSMEESWSLASCAFSQVS